MELQARAKVNLALDILAERPDGYHEIDTIFQEIALHDVLSIEPGRGGFVLTCSDPALSLDESNLIYKAWTLLRDRVDNDSVIIELEKNIPMAAGLAGGSTDAAATLIGLNRLWSLNLSFEELEALGAQIGSDVPFFIRGGTARATGRGERLRTLSRFHGKPILLINTGDTLSSRYIYDRVENNGTFDIDGLVELLEMESPKAYEKMQNQMETISFSVLPDLINIKEELLHQGARAALMSGSGPTMFGLFETTEQATKALNHFRGRYPFVHLTRTV